MHGNPAEELTHYADQHHPDLCILGAKGLRATLGILLGGVAQQVIEYSNWPVLVVRSPYIGLNRVLLVTDGSINSQKAALYMGKFPFPEYTEVYVVNVLPPMHLPESTMQHLAIGMEVISPITQTPEEIDTLLASSWCKTLKEPAQDHGNSRFAPNKSFEISFEP